MRYQNGNYHRGKDWDQRHSFPGRCSKCGHQDQKKNLVPLYVRRHSNKSIKVLCHLCPTCMAGLEVDLGVKIPECERGTDDGRNET